MDLKDSEYRNLTRKLLAYVDKGEFTLEHYLIVFRYTIRFNNLMDYNIPKLIKRFKNGIRKGVPNYNYVSSLSFELSLNSYKSYFKESKEIGDYCVQLNNQIKIEKEEEELMSWFSLLKMGKIEEFLEPLGQLNGKYSFTPVMTIIPYDKFIKRVYKIDNSQLIEMAFCFQSRYGEHINEKLYPEKGFLIGFKNDLENKLKVKRIKKLKKISIRFLLDKINECINNFP